MADPNFQRVVQAIERNDHSALEAALTTVDQAGCINASITDAHPFRPTLLHLAASMTCSAKVVDVLLKSGAGVMDTDARGWTSGHVCAGTGNIDGLNALLAADAALVHACTQSGLTPLHLACREAKPECVRALLLKGADPNAVGPAGNTPFHYAAGSSGKADADAVDSGPAARAREAAQAGGGAGRVMLRPSSRVINLLIAAGGDAARRNERGEVPLHVALREGTVEQVFDVVGAEPASLRALSAAFETPLDAAAAAGRADLLRPLLEHFAHADGGGPGGPAAALFAAAGGLLGEEEAAALGLDGGDDGFPPATGLAALRLDAATVNRARRRAAALGEAAPGGAAGSSPAGGECGEVLAGALRAAYGELAPGAALQRALHAALEGDAPLDALRALLPARHGAAAVDPDWLVEGAGRWEGLLHVAARRGRADALAWLLEEVGGARPGALTVDRRDRDSLTPLALAARAGHAPCAALLVRAGARPDFPSAEGGTPVHDAAAAGHADVLALLAAAPPPDPPLAAPSGLAREGWGGEEAARGVPWPLTVRTRQQQLTPLMIAARAAALPAVRAILEACPDGGAREAACGARSGSGRIAAHFAAEACGGPQRAAALEALAALVAAGGPPAADAEDLLGETPLAAAVRAGSIDATRALLGAGARAERGWHLAAARGDGALVELLHGALAGREGWAVDATDAAGTTALHHAALHGHAATVALLASLGARCEARDRARGLTPLHLACGEGHAAACEALLAAAGPAAAAAVQAADNFGITARQFATVRGHADVLAVLDRYDRATPPAGSAPAPAPGPAARPEAARGPAATPTEGAAAGRAATPALEADYERPPPGAHAAVDPPPDPHAPPTPAPSPARAAAALGALLAAHARRGPPVPGSPAWEPTVLPPTPGAASEAPSGRGAGPASSVAPECGSAASQRSDPGRRWRRDLAELAPAAIDVDGPLTRSTSSWIADAYRSYQHLRDSGRPEPDGGESPELYGGDLQAPYPAPAASSSAPPPAAPAAWAGYEVRRTTRDARRQGREAEAEAAVAGPGGRDVRAMMLTEVVPGLSGAQCARPLDVVARSTEARVEEDRTERSSATASGQLARVTLAPVTAAPLLVVHVAWAGREDRPLGFLEIPVDADLAFVRECARVEGLEGLDRPPRPPAPASPLPDPAAGAGAGAGEYRFGFAGAPVSRQQEARKLAVDCLVLAHGSLTLLLLPPAP